jgi:DNA-binding transcriptional MerR regulator
MSVQIAQDEAAATTRPTVQKAEVKSPNAFRTISEVATELDVPQHVLRFWESKFSQIRPMKRGGGRRYYRPEDVTVIKNIQNLLYNQGYTIRGVQKLLKESRSGVINRISTATPVAANVAPEKVGSLGLTVPQPQPKPNGLSAKKREELEGLLDELKSLRALLKQSGI